MLLSNPLTSPLWPTLAWTFFGLFVGSFAALLVTVRGHWQHFRQSVLFARWRTWIVIAPFLSVAALAGPLAMALLAAAVGLQASREYIGLSRLHPVDGRVLHFAAAVVPMAAIAIEPTWVALALPLVASLPALLQQDVRGGPTRVAHLAFGLWYAPLTLSLLVALERSQGPSVVLALALATAL